MLKVLTLLLATHMLYAAADFTSLQSAAVSDEYVLKLNGNKSYIGANAAASLLNVKLLKELSEQSNSILVQASQAKVNEIQHHPMVEYIEPNYIYSLRSLPNDNYFAKLWGLNNTGQADPGGNNGVAGMDINAIKGWKINHQAKDVIIGVIDTGINHQAEDLKNNMWVNDKELNGLPGIDDDENGYIDDIHGFDFVNLDSDPMDDHSHGSHVAGIIAAEGNNHIGVTGVAWSAQLMALKFLDARGTGTLANAILAIDYASENGARITNNSWGGGHSIALQEAIQRAEEKGILFVAAAGNSSLDNEKYPNYPSSYENENIIAVAAMDNEGKKARFSSWGNKSVDIAAPGQSIFSTARVDYKTLSGTSMATPYVTGALALLFQDNPDMKAKEAKARLLNTSRPSSYFKNKSVSEGVLDLYALLSNTNSAPHPDDPGFWPSIDYSLSSAHPYENNLEQEYEINVPEAKAFAIYFKKFETEKNYDKLKIYDASDKLVSELSGNHSDTFSPVIPGKRARLVFKSDNTLNAYGFEISKLMIKK